MTILIVEGTDLSGKTYAIEKIAKHFNSGFVLKNSYKPKYAKDSNSIYAQYWNIISLIIEQKDLIILDRFFPSQAVYSYLRGKDEFNHREIKSLDRYAFKENFLYIYLDTPKDLLEHRFKERGDEHIKFGQIRELKDRYDSFFESTLMEKIKIDTTKSDWLEILTRWINEKRTIKNLA